jgi:hypothetical protein
MVTSTRGGQAGVARAEWLQKARITMIRRLLLTWPFGNVGLTRSARPSGDVP